MICYNLDGYINSYPPCLYMQKYASVNRVSVVSDNGLSPIRHQAIIRTNAGIVLVEHFGTNFCEILIEILSFSFTKMRLKVSSAK